MSNESRMSPGAKFGLIGGLVYVVLLIILYSYPPFNPVTFAFYKFLVYLVVLFFLVLCAREQRNHQGGYATVRDLMRQMLIAIVTLELFYATFNYIYLNLIEPDFLDNLVNNTRLWLESKGIPEDQIEAQMEQIKVSRARPNLVNTISGIGVWIVIDSLFAFIIAAVIKREKPPFGE